MIVTSAGTNAPAACACTCKCAYSFADICRLMPAHIILSLASSFCSLASFFILSRIVFVFLSTSLSMFCHGSHLFPTTLHSISGDFSSRRLLTSGHIFNEYVCASWHTDMKRKEITRAILLFCHSYVGNHMKKKDVTHAKLLLCYM